MYKLKLAALAWLGTNWGVAVACVVATFLLLASVLVFGQTTFFTNLDNVDQFYTWYQKLATSVHQGYLPIWNANTFSGQSFAGELQPGVFYPLNIIWVWLFGSGAGISQLALDYLVAVHFALAAFGSYLLLKQLGAEKWAAFLAGITFAFSGGMAFRSISQTAIFFGLSLLPLALFFFVKAYGEVKKRWLWLGLAGAFLGLIILSGHIAPFYFALLSMGIFALVWLWGRRASWAGFARELLKVTKDFAVVLTMCVLVALPQIWVSTQYLGDSYRIQATGYLSADEKIDYGHFAKSFSLEIHEFINLVDPVTYQIRDGNSIFIGLATLGFIAVAVFAARVRFKESPLWKRHRAFAIWLLIIGGVAMIGYATWFAVVLYGLPFVYQVRQLGRYGVLFDLALIVILAVSLPAVAKLTLSKRQKLWLIGVGGFLLINAVYLFALRNYIFNMHLALQTGLLALGLLMVALVHSARYRRLLITALVLVTALVNTIWFLPAIKADTKTAKSYALAPALVAVLEQTNGQYRVETQEDALPVNAGNVYQFQSTWGYGATVYVPYYDFTHKANLDPEFVKDILGVQLVAQKQGPTSGQGIAYSDQASGIYVVRRPTALPKFFVGDEQGSADRAAYRPLAVMTEAYKDQYQRYSVTTDMAVMATVSEIAYPGWVAKVDGKPVDISTYNVAGYPLLKSLPLPAGTHTVELIYKPFKLF